MYANCPSWWPTDIPFTRAEGIHSFQYAYSIYMMCQKRQKKTTILLKSITNTDGK